MLVAEADGTEPIGSRIIEVPADDEQAELRNPRSGFIAYVPKGSLKKGEALVRDRRRRGDDRVHGLSRAGPAWHGRYTGDRGPFAEPDDAAAYRHQRRREEWLRGLR